ncbi:chemotaxis response regulator protein-glutamate methylesterase, partial [Mycobacterium tuberculosis]|nr:chemotaxis response regulator protein-glutamate methylesterase [Mycobacterium tuberculosis]
TQHMPPTFTTILAEHLTKASGRRAAEGVHGEPLMPGRIYVAPGGKHMVIAKHGSETVIELNDLPPVNFCKPAVDPLFLSVVPLYGAA